MNRLETPPLADATVPVRTYEIAFRDGQLIRVDIPETWKVTYGPVVGADGGGSKVFAFRAWETAERQRIMLTEVTSFRDVSRPIMVRAVRRFGAGDDEWFVDDGTWVGAKGTAVEHGWRPADDVLSFDPAEQSDIVKGDEDDGWAPKRLTGMHPRRDRAVRVGGR